MASSSVLFVVGLAVVVGLTSAYRVADRHITRDDDPYEEEIRSIQDHLPDCRELFASCRGVPSCCEDMVCYWENGFSALKDGVCVPCVDRTQTCHRDGQCCENTICQKNNPWDVDGVCELRKDAGEECYRDAQCNSRDCDKSWYEVHGTCN